MLKWAIRHYKIVIASMGLVIASIITPLIIGIFNFIVDSRSAQAMVQKHEEKILKVQEVVISVDTNYQNIRESLHRIEEREYQELRAARQLRQAQK